MMAQRFINAAKDGYLDVLSQATKRDLNSPDEDGMTAVMWAAHNGHLDALRITVGRGGDVDKCDYLGLTALHHAAQRGLMHVVSYLVNWGANIYALDNDHHSALDLASLHERTEVVTYLDQVYSQHQSKNPKHAARQREDAVRHAERNLRRYHKLQDEAARRLQKEQRKQQHNMAISQQDGVKNGGGGKNFIKSLTMAIRGSSGGHKSRSKAPSASGKSYSDIAGLNQSLGTRSINGKRHDHDHSHRHGQDVNGEAAGSGPGRDRLALSMSERDMRGGTSSEVMYGQGDRRAMMADGTSSRPAVYDVFGNHSYRGTSEMDTKDSGVVSYFGDEDDEDMAPGMFNRPGFGKTAFLTGNNFLNTLPSFEMDADADGAARASTNGLNSHHNDSGPSTVRDQGSSLGEEVSLPDSSKDPLPWDQEDVDKLDDDDDAMVTTSALETFLWTAGLEAYLHRFLQERVDMELLLTMSDADLREMGLPFGPRKRLLEAIKQRQTVLSLPRHMTDSFL